MDKKIAGEFAVGVILLIAIIISGIFWFQSASRSKVSQALATKQDQAAVSDQSGDSCKPHYYGGEAKLQGWIAQDDKNSDSEVIVQIKDGDAKNLPVTNPETLANFTVKLIDPTDEVKDDLKLATKEKPATVVVRGYAEICQQPPLVSIQDAKIAFKKS